MVKVSILFYLFLSIALPFSFAETLPTPQLLRSQDLQRHYQNAFQGEQVIELASTSEKFLALSLEQQTNSPQGGLLFLHDSGQTADWPFLLQQARQYLPSVGWNTLSINLPTPQREAIAQRPLTGNEVVISMSETTEQWQARILERIAAGIKHLNDQGLFNIVLIGYGDGGYWASRYLAERLTETEKDSYALVLIEAPLQYSDLSSFVGQLNIPIFDLYMNDSDFAHRQAENRKAAAMRAEHTDYTQVHDMLRQSFLSVQKIDRTTRRIWGWLRNHASGHKENLIAKPTS